MMGRQPGFRVGPLQTFNRPTALGEALERVRVAAGLTFKELAERSRVSRRTLLSIANAENFRPDGYARYCRVGYRTVDKLDAALSCRLGDLSRQIEAERAAALQQKVQRGSALHRKRSSKVQRGSA
jgi:transcriptional regulator with XRE-family HTH domain